MGERTYFVRRDLVCVVVPETPNAWKGSNTPATMEMPMVAAFRPNDILRLYPSRSDDASGFASLVAREFVERSDNGKRVAVLVKESA